MGASARAILLHHLFGTVVARCMAEGLVGGEAFAVDASVIVADAQRRRGVAKVGDLDPMSNRAVAAYLSVLDDAAFGGATPVEPKARTLATAFQSSYAIRARTARTWVPQGPLRARGPRTIPSINFPLGKCSRLIRRIVSTISVPHRPLPNDSVEEPRMLRAAMCARDGFQRGEGGPRRLMWRRLGWGRYQLGQFP